MVYQARRDKHRTTAREFRVINAAAAHDLVLEVPGEARPAAGHMVQMPAHIYQRVGRYADRRNRENGWARYGLMQALKAQSRGATGQ
jgi:hypothetical protein